MGYLVFNRNARKKVILRVQEGKQFVTDASTFVKENQEEISDLIKGTTEKVNGLVQVAGKDVEEIAKHSSHLKGTATDMIDTAKVAAKDLQQYRLDQQESPEPSASLPQEHENSNKRQV